MQIITLVTIALGAMGVSAAGQCKPKPTTAVAAASPAPSSAAASPSTPVPSTNFPPPLSYAATSTASVSPTSSIATMDTPTTASSTNPVLAVFSTSVPSTETTDTPTTTSVPDIMPTPEATTSLMATSTSEAPVPSATTDSGFFPVFTNATGAIAADDYDGFALVDTLEECLLRCAQDTISDCNFVNFYFDKNGKDGSQQMTCAMFTKCHDITEATNLGGQSQPDGSIDQNIESSGWCKNPESASAPGS